MVSKPKSARPATGVATMFIVELNPPGPRRVAAGQRNSFLALSVLAVATRYGMGSTVSVLFCRSRRLRAHPS